MITCVGGIHEAKDIALRVTRERKGIQESHKTMQKHVMRVQDQHSDVQHQIGRLGSGAPPHEPGRAVSGDGARMGPDLRDLTQVQTRLWHLERKLADMAHHGVLQRVLALETHRHQ